MYIFCKRKRLSLHRCYETGKLGILFTFDFARDSPSFYNHLQWSLFFAMWSSFGTLAPVLWLCSPESTQPGLIRFCWNQFRLRVSSRENLRWRFKKLAFIIICQTSEDFMAFFYKENITSFQLWRQDRVPNSDLKFKINKAGSFQMIIDYIFVLLADLAQILIKIKRLTLVNPKHFSPSNWISNLSREFASLLRTQTELDCNSLICCKV